MDLVIAIVAGLLGGGVFSGLAAWRRSKPAGRLDEIRGIREANDELRTERIRLAQELGVERERRQKLEQRLTEHLVKFRQLENELRRWEARSAELEERLNSLFAWIRLNTSFDPENLDHE